MTGADDAAARLDFLEAAYAWEIPEEQWLANVIERAAAAWGRPSYAFGLIYDASDLTRFRVSRSVVVSGPPILQEMLLAAWARFTPEVVAATYRSVPMGFGRPIGVIDEKSSEDMKTLAIADVFALNGLDPSGKGCAIGLGVDRTTVTEEGLLLFHRMTAHLASAYRCRRRMLELQEDAMHGWEALLAPGGRLLEARGPARSSSARSALHDAASSMVRVRRRKGKDEPTTSWRPRVRSRWTLVDAYAQDGERYIVARENQAPAPGLEGLTEREQQVVVSAALGKSGKEIAYDLGISHATVRVLLARASSRLGATSTEQLLQLPVVRALRGEAPGARD
jgi:DNA-binding CsgD family transcriptional regulator